MGPFFFRCSARLCLAHIPRQLPLLWSAPSLLPTWIRHRAFDHQTCRPRLTSCCTVGRARNIITVKHRSWSSGVLESCSRSSVRQPIGFSARQLLPPKRISNVLISAPSASTSLCKIADENLLPLRNKEAIRSRRWRLATPQRPLLQVVRPRQDLVDRRDSRIEAELVAGRVGHERFGILVYDVW